MTKNKTTALSKGKVSFLRLRSIQDSAFMVFGITIGAYVINLVYELTRLSSYGISHDLVQVKLQNFLLMGVMIGGVVGVAGYVQAMLFKAIEKRIKGEAAVVYVKEKVLQCLTLGTFALIFLFGSSVLRYVGQEPFFVQGFLGLGLASAVGVVFVVVSVGWLYLRAKGGRMSFLKAVEERYEKAGAHFVSGRKPAVD